MTGQPGEEGQLVAVWFEGEIKLSQHELDEAGGDVRQAVQNAIGPAGAMVEEAEILEALAKRRVTE